MADNRDSGLRAPAQNAGDARAGRDPFTDDALERLARSNIEYYRAHGHYVPPLAQRLLDSRAANAALTKELEDLRAGVSGSPDETRAKVDAANASVRHVNNLRRRGYLSVAIETAEGLCVHIGELVALAGVGEHRPDQPQKPLVSAQERRAPDGDTKP